MKKIGFPMLFLCVGVSLAVSISEWVANGNPHLWIVLAVAAGVLGPLIENELSAPWRIATGFCSMAAGTCLTIGINAINRGYHEPGIMFTMPGVLLLVITILIVWLVPRAYPHTTPS